MKESKQGEMTDDKRETLPSITEKKDISEWNLVLSRMTSHDPVITEKGSVINGWDIPMPRRQLPIAIRD